MNFVIKNICYNSTDLGYYIDLSCYSQGAKSNNSREFMFVIFVRGEFCQC
jgi:hypothetical protein